MKKKVLFPILALVLALGLALPMAAPATATTDTTVIDPTWEVTNNSMIDSSIGVALPWTDVAWGGWNSNAWPGPANGIYGHPIGYHVPGDTWMDWLHGPTPWTTYTHMWFRTTVNIPSSWVVTAVDLVYKYNEAILPINDDLYVYVNGTYCAAGGTATDSVVAPLLPAAPPNPSPYGTFKTALGVDFTTAPETGWYLNGGLSLPASLFTSGSNQIHVLGEEMDISGGLGHMVFKVTYEVADIEKSFVDSATYTIDVEEADLGDIVGVKLEVENPYAYDLTVMDIIPDGLKYIPGTFEVDGSPVTPTITDNTISTTVGQGDFTITFDVQVVEVQCIVQEDVENRAFLYNGNVQLEASDEIDLNPYEGFDKVIDSGVKEHNGGFIELPDPTVVPIGTDVNWWVLIEVENIDDDAIETMEDVVVQDRLGGDLELLITNVWDDLYGAYSGWTPPGGKKDERTDNTGNVTVQWTGETKKVHLTWDVGDMDDTDSETLALKISTDINPGTGHGKKASGQQEYTSPGWKELNSGAVVKFTDIDGTGFQLSAHTCPLSVYVPDGKLTLDNKDPSTWQIIEDEIGGKLYYSTEGDEFSFVFQGYDLEEEEDYSLIYYADTEDRYVDWGGDNPGALIGTGMTDGAGNLVLSGSIDLGMDLPHPDDANGYHYDYTQAPDYYDNGTGAKIWLVPSDCLTGSTDLPVVVWAPTRFLFETDLITYDDTDD